MRVLDPTPNPRLAALSLQELGFIEFEHRVFGCANGPGKPHVLRALKGLCEAMSGGYDYQIVEQAITAPVAWLLINALRNADMIEQGTPIRFTDRGVALAEFVRARSVENLVGLAYDSTKESP